MHNYIFILTIIIDNMNILLWLIKYDPEKALIDGVHIMKYIYEIDKFIKKLLQIGNISTICEIINYIDFQKIKVRIFQKKHKAKRSKIK